MKRILVVLSGGQDSTTCLFWAKKRIKDFGGGELHAITFNYGQRHAAEIAAAECVASMADVNSHETIDVPNCLISTSPLISKNELERYDSYEQMDKLIGTRVELTFVPMRNTLFLTIAMNRAISLKCTEIVTGVCQQDNANYPDCRLDYIEALQRAFTLSLGEEYVHIMTPLMHRTKAMTVRLASELPGCMEALAFSHTSYDGKYPPIDKNHANVLRAQGFLEAGMADPLVIRAYHEGLMDLPETPNYDTYRRSGV